MTFPELAPRLYDLAQSFLGLKVTLEKLAPHLAGLDEGIVLDVGGGTGLYGRQLPKTARYICLDLNPSRLARARGVTPRVLCSDATRMALKNESVDCALCIGVAHHLDESELDALMSELHRVVRRRVVFVEPLLHQSLTSRLLWNLDAGSHPRTDDALLRRLMQRFSIGVVERYEVYHRYLLFVGVRVP